MPKPTGWRIAKRRLASAPDASRMAAPAPMMPAAELRGRQLVAARTGEDD
jgi:hypothetical protein